MGKIIKFLFSRAVTTALLIIVQVLFTVAVLYGLSAYSKYVYNIFFFISACFVIYLFSSNQIIEYKLIWSLVIFLFPPIGGLFYILWGKRSTDWRALNKLRIIYDNTSFMLDKDNSAKKFLSEQDASLDRVASYLQNNTGAGVYNNCNSTYYPCGEDFFQPYLDALASAEKFILMEYFILEKGKLWNSVLNILTEKIKKGVEVYLLYDDAGSVAKVPNMYYKQLQKLGIKAYKFNKLRPRMYTLMNYRDHRKITVVDGKIAFTGGLNLADEYINATHPCGYWKDSAVKIEGEIVWELTLMFFQLWQFASKKHINVSDYRVLHQSTGDGFIQFFGDDPLDEINVSEDTYMALIAKAKKYVYITSPYLIIDNRIIGALQTAARSGLDVRIITPGVPDKKLVFYATQSYYHTLVDAGVKIYEYLPGFIHAKNMVIDDDVAVVGTVNMDYRSLYLHFECAAVFYKNHIPFDVKADIEKTLEDCKEITETEIKNTFVLKRLLQAFLRIFAPLM